ncbi:variable surface protein [Plasmodium gonderi]|uniref:Variable surface protein n=1 Tax=Plasmodium gonderi TaxID=77519 RepID=A0A1Y1JUN7_PLAGO|nr:variable surface protein [Plasmodium gonderi]GAW84462.1 variable surface protein [Plasmodium gonderi]
MTGTTKWIIDFSNILRNCRNFYNSINWNHYMVSLRNNLSSVCSDFQNIACPRGCHISNFIKTCQVLGLYLYSIEKKINQSINEKEACIYFFYKLKNLMNSQNTNCKITSNCYMEMLKKNSRKPNRMDISNICMKFSSVHNDFDNYTYKIIKYMEELYDNFEILKRYNSNKSIHEARNSASLCNTKYQELFSMLKIKKNTSFIDYLNNYKSEYDQIMIEITEYENKSKKIIPPTIESVTQNQEQEQDQIKKKIPEYKTEYRNIITLDKVKAVIKAPLKERGKQQTLPITNKSSDISAGMAVFTCTLLVLIFILYKYTTYGTILYPYVKKIKEMLKKKKNEYHNLMDSSYMKYNNIINKKNRITYSVVDYY